MSQVDDSRDIKIVEIIRDRIASYPQQRLTFAEYMDLVLYHPEFGYYAKQATQIGTKGDFFTSPHLGSDFGECLAAQFEQMWEILDCPHPFNLVEMGAGQGILAKDILGYLQENNPDLFAALEYIIVEKSPQMRGEQARNLAGFRELVKWLSWDEMADESICGCFFSNELVDAFPVHQVTVRGGKLKEIYVSVDSETGKIYEIVGELSTLEIEKYFERSQINITGYEDGYRTEVNLESDRWLMSLASKLKRGYIITIDYGYSAHRYYNPFRQEGTLQCYSKHQYHNNPYINIGEQDLTAHVNFTSLEIQGKACGLETVGLTQQGMFLMALGLGEKIAAISQMSATNAREMQQVLQRRQALHQLIDPMGLGKFNVLIQSKDLNSLQKSLALKGLSIY